MPTSNQDEYDETFLEIIEKTDRLVELCERFNLPHMTKQILDNTVRALRNLVALLDHEAMTIAIDPVRFESAKGLGLNAAGTDFGGAGSANARRRNLRFLKQTTNMHQPNGEVLVLKNLVLKSIEHYRAELKLDSSEFKSDQPSHQSPL